MTAGNSHLTNVFTNKYLWSFFLVVVLVIAISSAGYFYFQYQTLNQTQTTDAQELAAVVKKVNQLMELPEEETPVLATVTDKEKVAAQAFFSRSENGDKVLLYTQLGRAILYRPSTNKIVDITIINATETADSSIDEAIIPSITPSIESIIISPTIVPISSPSAALLTKVALLNGTKTSGLAGTSERRLLPAVPDIQISRKGNAVQQNYLTTQVITVAANASQKASEIASFYKATVSSQLPEGETGNDADVVVILGEDAR